MGNIFQISDYKDISNLWENRQNETLNLEYKKEISTDSKEIAKDVSSFANAEGGVIIYGMDEDNGRSVKSDGIKITQNSERIEQIISSSTAPIVPIDIVNIDIPASGDSRPTKEFVVVKIPKSPFLIHQVTTTSKYYIRNNRTTSQQIYEPFEMKENEIALRYQIRFKSKQEQISFFQTREQKIASELGWNGYFVISIVPHVRIPDSIKVTADYFKSLFINSQSYVIYHDLLEAMASFSIPNYDGRSSDPHSVKRTYIEINNDRSVHQFIRNDEQHKADEYTPMFALGPMLHLVRRILDNTKYYGGVTLRIRLNGNITTEEPDHVSIPTAGRIVSNLDIQHEIPYSPIKVGEEYRRIFEKYFEALHIDNALKIYEDSTIAEVMQRLTVSESLL